MSFRTTPLFAGDMYDTALRLAASADAPRSEDGAASAKWQQMLALGWQGVLIPEDAGGAGATLEDLAAIVEALARHGHGLLLAERCAVAPAVLHAARARADVAALLARVADGSASVCPVIDAGSHAPGARTAPLRTAAGPLRGTLQAADLGEPASHLLFNLRDEHSGATEIVSCPLARLEGRARHYHGVDGRRNTDFTLDGLVPEEAEIILRGAAAEDAVAAARHAGSLLACVQAVGAAGAMVELSIEYLNGRVQFGVALSSFQALRHHTVEMYVATENAAGLVRRLVTLASTQGLAGFPREVALAKLYAATLARSVSESAIQLHGGMGMTLEMQVARVAMHAMAASLRYADRAECTDWLDAQALAQLAAA